MVYNSGVYAARNNAPRCIANLRTTLLEEPPLEHFTPRGGGVWVLEDSPQSLIFGVSESVLFSLGFWKAGDIGSSLTFLFTGISGVVATQRDVDLKVAPIYLEWEIQTSEASPRTLIFDPSAHGYEAESAMLDYDRPSRIKSRGYGKLAPTTCENCSRVGRFQFFAAFRYADDLEQLDGRIPLENLFEAMNLIGVCVDCNRAAAIYDSAL